AADAAEAGEGQPTIARAVRGAGTEAAGAQSQPVQYESADAGAAAGADPAAAQRATAAAIQGTAGSATAGGDAGTARAASTQAVSAQPGAAVGRSGARQTSTAAAQDTAAAKTGGGNPDARAAAAAQASEAAEAAETAQAAQAAQTGGAETASRSATLSQRAERSALDAFAARLAGERGLDGNDTGAGVAAAPEAGARAAAATSPDSLPWLHAAAQPGATSLTPATSTVGMAPTVASATIATPLDHADFPGALSAELTRFALDGIERAEIVLQPRELGPIRIELSLNGESASIAFAAAQPDTRQAIEQSLPLLKDMLSQHGLTLADSSVSDGNAGRGGAPYAGTGHGAGNGSERPSASAGPTSGILGEVGGGRGSPDAATGPGRLVTARGLLDLYA
ncbi:MAG: flagellar hook-length control protein FliK, partial [Burkholderiaceae bacterium]